jgi:hypothetical protein
MSAFGGKADKMCFESKLRAQSIAGNGNEGEHRHAGLPVRSRARRTASNFARRMLCRSRLRWPAGPKFVPCPSGWLALSNSARALPFADIQRRAPYIRRYP